MHRLIPYAHRGGAGEVVENSDIAVARTAARAGWRLETDVRLSADGHIVLSHDANLRRAWGSTLTLRALRGTSSPPCAAPTESTSSGWSTS
ncbi:glycerophosphodiester phosphodiesterase [Nanchangia anserum]|uniref:glycerophosphodiester phosphodiesterase n=1 Tax=Nanchangia anserum TaxID=2692125 RepID=UPI001D10673A|nr:glycerophosphodiester phosphodiesterase family protein [Nanchangia anserum]